MSRRIVPQRGGLRGEVIVTMAVSSIREMPGETVSPEGDHFRSALTFIRSANSLRFWWIRPVTLGCAIGIVFGFGTEIFCVLFGRNLHEVIPGRVYRCAQLTGKKLEEVIKRQGIRTVVNLRGCGLPLQWYMSESRVTHLLNVAQEDIFLSAGRLPSIHEIRRLIQVLDCSEYPILLHCRQGADRTGLAAVLVLLLQTDCDISMARKELGVRFGHLAIDGPAYLDRFFELYEKWLVNENLEHSPVNLRHWIEQDSCPGMCLWSYEALNKTDSVAACMPVLLKIRAYNTGRTSWHFRPESNVGMHLCFVLKDDHGRGIATGRFGLFEKEVEPGKSIDLKVIFPALQKPGHYRYMLDLVDEQHCWFHHTGSEPLEGELVVHD